VVIETSSPSEEVWTTQVSPVWVGADNAGGALAAVAWYDENDVEEVRFYYAVSGWVTEMGLTGTTWSTGSVLE